MPRSNANKKKHKTEHTQKQTKLPLPREFYDKYILAAKCDATTNKDNEINELLENSSSYRMDIYSIEKILKWINKNTTAVNPLEKMNVIQTTLAKLLPLCEEKSNEYREKLIRNLFKHLCFILESITTKYLSPTLNNFHDSEYLAVHEYIREKNEWYNQYAEEYYNFLLKDASELVCSSVSDKWSPCFDAISDTLNCSLQILIFCQLLGIDGIKSEINSKNTAFINSLTSILSTKKHKATINAREQILIYQKQTLNIESTYTLNPIWSPFFSKLYDCYKISWLNTEADYHCNKIDMNKIKISKDIFLDYNKLPLTRKNNDFIYQSVLNELPQIANFLEDYLKNPEENLSETIVRSYADLCVQVLIFIKQSVLHPAPHLNPLHKTTHMLLKKLYEDRILKSLVREIKIKEHEISNVFEKLSLDTLNSESNQKASRHDEVNCAKDITYKKIEATPVIDNEIQSQAIDFEEKKFKQEKRQQKRAYNRRLKSMQKTHSSILQQIKSSNEDALSKIQETHEIEINNTKKTLEKIRLKKIKEYDRKIERLNKSHQADLDKLDEEFKNQFEKICDNFKTEKEKKSNEQEKILGNLKLNYLNRINKNNIVHPKQKNITPCNLSTLEKSGHLNNPIATLTIPPEKNFILSTLIRKGFECYVIGGWVRDRLRLGDKLSNLPLDDRDFDVIVNADAVSVQNALKWQGHQPSGHPYLVILGNIDFWCEPWNDLCSMLRKKDLTVNAFICDVSTYKVYDILGVRETLFSEYIVPLSNATHQSFKEDPVKMLRFLRFSVQLHKKISPIDREAILQQGHLIKTIPLGIYLKNISSMFLSQYGVNCFYSLQNDTLLAVFPFLDENDTLHLYRNPQHYHIIANALNKLLNSNDVYSVLALMMLIPILRHGIAKDHIDEFIRNNLLVIWPNEKNKILDELRSYQNILCHYIEFITQHANTQPLNAQQIEIPQHFFDTQYLVNPISRCDSQRHSHPSITINYDRQRQATIPKADKINHENIAAIPKNR